MTVPSASLPVPEFGRSEERWYLVSTLARREHYAFEHLSRQGYRPFLPTAWRTIRHARKVQTVKSAFFPGYLFVPLNLSNDHWRPIDGTFGVASIVKANGRPLAAPRGLVETLSENTGTDGVLDLARDLEKGATVRLVRGPFADQLATVVSMSGADKVRVLMSLMQQDMRVEVNRADLAIHR